MATRARTFGDLDLWLAFVAGSAVWREPDKPVEGLELVGLIHALSLGGTALVGITLQPGVDRSLTVRLAAMLLVGVCGALLAADAVAVLAGARPPAFLTDRPYGAALARTAAGLGFLGSWLALTPPAAYPLLLLLAPALGADVTLTAWSIPVTTSPARWARSLARSWLHAGALAGVVAVLVLVRTSRAALTSAVVLASAWALVLTSLFVVHTLAAARHRLVAARRAADGLLTAEEHRRRSHWLHDDVLSLLTGVQLKLERHQWGSAETAREIRELDHHLRVRQAEELLASGTASVGEMLQPYLRHAQNMGLTIAEAPSRDTAALRLSPEHAALVQRVFGVTLPNAINAGATKVAVRLTLDGTSGELVIEVEDDAGGFDLDDTPVGRGLDSLRQSLEPDALTVRTTAHGSLVVARLRVPLEVRP